MNIANLGKRILSYIIDTLILSIIPSFTLFFLYLNTDLLKDISIYLVVICFIFVLWFLYFIFIGLFLLISNGRTIGNLIFGIRVIHKDISHLTFGDCFARSSTQGLIILAIISVFYVMTIHTEKSAFDRLTNTVVVDWRNREK